MTVKTSAIVLCIAAIATVNCGADAKKKINNKLTPAEIADGWELLFDGKTMNGWRDYNGTSLTQPWHAVNGCIQAKGAGSDGDGYIVSDKQYDNFILDWDWKLTYGGNSGMIYHVVENPYFKVPYVTGPEYQLIDVKGWEERNAPAKLEEWQKIGVDYAMHLPDQDSLFVNGPGKWNNSRIIFDNGHVEHYLNGHKILEFEAWTDDWQARKNSGKWGHAPEYGLARTGVLCIQDHGDPASFRNIKIKRLPKKDSGTITLFNGHDLKGWTKYGNGTWTVKDGIIYGEAAADKDYSYLATNDYYKDFDLMLRFRQDGDGNSGVFFRSIMEPPTKVHGWQCEIAPAGESTGGVFESYGRGWLKKATAEQEKALKPGNWNLLRVRVEGDHVQTWLNGTPVADFTDAAIGKGDGRIMLQLHEGGKTKMEFKDIVVKRL